MGTLYSVGFSTPTRANTANQIHWQLRSNSATVQIREIAMVSRTAVDGFQVVIGCPSDIYGNGTTTNRSGVAASGGTEVNGLPSDPLDPLSIATVNWTVNQTGDFTGFGYGGIGWLDGMTNPAVGSGFIQTYQPRDLVLGPNIVMMCETGNTQSVGPPIFDGYILWEE